MGSYTPITLTSHQITSVEQSTRREHSSWDSWFFVGGYGYAAGPFGYGQRPWYAATGTAADRLSGRQLPLFWSEVDLRGFRLVARDLDSRNQFAIGFLNLLTAYHVHKGYGWQATYRGSNKTPYPTKKTNDPVLKRAQQILDAWRDANLWPLKSREAFRRWRRDGEVFGRFFPSGWDRLPQFRFVDPERVGSPTGDVNGPESFGIRTDEEDVCEVLEFHIWESPDGTEGRWVGADRVIHAKVNVDTGIKRGVTDFLPVAEDFDWCRRILRSMLVSSQRQASKAWIEKLPGATAEQVRGMVPYVPGRTTQSPNPSNAYDPFDGYRGYGYDPTVREPDGSIMRTEGDREFAMTPGSNVQGYIEAMQSALRGCCARWGMPEFLTSDASNNNYASALVAHSPFVKMVEGQQYEFGAAWERPVALKVLELAAEAGLLDVADLRRLDVEITEPQVASAEPDKDAQTNNVLHAAGVMSATTWQLKLGLDPQHEAANFEQEKLQGMQPGPEPTDDQTPAINGGSDELKQLTAKLEDKRSGLVKKTITNKQGNQQTVYVRPDGGKSGDESHPATVDPPKADTLDLSGVSDNPGVVAKLKDRASKALTRLARLAYDAALASPNIIEAAGMLIDTPDDLKKIGYNPATAGSDSQQVADPLKDAGIPLTTYQAVNLVTTVLPAAIAWVKGKISGGKSEGDDIEALAELLHQMLKVMAEEFGLEMPPDAGTIANNLRSL